MGLSHCRGHIDYIRKKIASGILYMPRKDILVCQLTTLNPVFQFCVFFHFIPGAILWSFVILNYIKLYKLEIQYDRCLLLPIYSPRVSFYIYLRPEAVCTFAPFRGFVCGSNERRNLLTNRNKIQDIGY